MTGETVAILMTRIILGGKDSQTDADAGFELIIKNIMLILMMMILMLII